MGRLISLVVLFFLVISASSSSLFVLDQTRYALLVGSGNVSRVVVRPGIHVKWPSPLQNVVFVDKRLGTLETRGEERVSTLDKEDVVIDGFVKWNVADAKQFYESINGDVAHAQERLAVAFRTALTTEAAKYTASGLVVGDHQHFADGVRTGMSSDLSDMGVDIQDMRIRRVDYVESARSSIFDKMRAARSGQSTEARAKGAAEAAEIRAAGDRQQMQIAADGYKAAEELRGQGDAQATQIYADAYGQNPEFYRFYRSLEAYKASFSRRQDVLVIDPSSDFFKYMKSAGLPGVASQK